MKTKKLLALGLLSAMAVTSLSGTSVFAAAEAGGSTNFQYTPGQSTGTDPDTGNLADWTVDYPVKVVLDDSTISADTGRVMNFKLYNTKDDGTKADVLYNKEKTVAVSLVQHAQTVNTTGIKMMSGSSAQENVVMSITADDGSTLINTSTETEVLSLDKTNNQLTSKAFLAKNTGATKGTVYTQTLTWKFVEQ